MIMLERSYTHGQVEAGCDEAGRGCLAGPVYAAAVILPPEYENPLLDDSKKLNKKQRLLLRADIEENALDWQVASCSNLEIDEINILNASFEAMHRALAGLKTSPELILVDGNRFKPFGKIPHVCIVKGDGKFNSIAAASILAKTYRDKFMEALDLEYPGYRWSSNKGYPSREHKAAITRLGITPYHRRSFRLNEQMKLEL